MILRLKNKSIIKKILISIILALIVQASIFIGIILCSGILKSFSEDSFNTLNDKVREKKMYLENEMVHEWSNINKSEEDINSTILDTLKSKGLTTNELNSDENLSSEILNDISKDIMLMIRKANVTGGFIILNTNGDDLEESEKIEKQGIYIINADESSYSKDNTDLILKRGPESIANNLNMPLDANWSSKYKIDNTDLNYKETFFYKVMNTANKYRYSSYKDLGYWSKPFKLEDDNIQVITYSVPLIDSEGNPYGVLGIDITLDFIKRAFEKNKFESYVVATTDDKDMSFQSIISVGKLASDIVKPNQNIKFKDENIYNNTYEIEEDENISNKIYGSVNYLNLYSKNTPFENERWSVLGLEKRNDLLYNINKLRDYFVISLVSSILLGIVFAFVLENKIIKPITGLAQKVKQMDPKKPLVLDKINISEIDDLSLAITNLSVKVADSASKLSQIINLLNMPIGAFEYKDDEEFVFCTKGFFDILEIRNMGINTEGKYISRVVFKLIMRDLLSESELELNEVEVYKIKDSKGNQKWIRLKIKAENLKKFGVITNVTEEILEKRRIEYERDYDILTNLLNRRAFRRIIINKLQEKNLKIGAFVMWDLDNLKYVNDTYGHDFGDEYIREASRVLKEFDNYNAIVSRKSGDEFFVFIYGYSSKDEIRKIVKKIHKKMKDTIYAISNDIQLRIRASVGIAWYPDDSKEYYELSRYSDFAMYKIKHTIKGNISEFNKDEYNEESFLLKDKEKLNKLIEEELVQYAFQPIVNARTGETYAYEALMRSNLETMKNPRQIIELATAESKLYQIEKLTWFKALQAFAKHKEEFGEAKLFINSIPNYVLTDKDSKEFKEIYGQYSSNLVIEFLENERSTSQSTLKKLHFIKAINAKLAIDDFGAGYNNEATLLDISPDFVKIDMEIVRGIDKDLNRQQISKNLISYAKGRNIKVIAEGVETKKELEKLIELGIDYVQGYYLSKPEFIPPKIQENLIQEIIDISMGKCV